MLSDPVGAIGDLEETGDADELSKEIDERVGAFLNRPLEGDWPYLWLDAAYLKGRTLTLRRLKLCAIARALDDNPSSAVKP